MLKANYLNVLIYTHDNLLNIKNSNDIRTIAKIYG